MGVGDPADELRTLDAGVGLTAVDVVVFELDFLIANGAADAVFVRVPRVTGLAEIDGVASTEDRRPRAEVVLLALDMADEGREKPAGVAENKKDSRRLTEESRRLIAEGTDACEPGAGVAPAVPRRPRRRFIYFKQYQKYTNHNKRGIHEPFRVLAVSSQGRYSSHLCLPCLARVASTAEQS